jgi:hypothetical protein
MKVKVLNTFCLSLSVKCVLVKDGFSLSKERCATFVNNFIFRLLFLNSKIGESLMFQILIVSKVNVCPNL